jgi:hypothetical protein
MSHRVSQSKSGINEHSPPVIPNRCTPNGNAGIERASSLSQRNTASTPACFVNPRHCLLSSWNLFQESLQTKVSTTTYLGSGSERSKITTYTLPCGGIEPTSAPPNTPNTSPERVSGKVRDSVLSQSQVVILDRACRFEHSGKARCSECEYNRKLGSTPLLPTKRQRTNQFNSLAPLPKDIISFPDSAVRQATGTSKLPYYRDPLFSSESDSDSTVKDRRIPPIHLTPETIISLSPPGTVPSPDECQRIADRINEQLEAAHLQEATNQSIREAAVKTLSTYDEKCSLDSPSVIARSELPPPLSNTSDSESPELDIPSLSDLHMEHKMKTVSTDTDSEHEEDNTPMYHLARSQIFRRKLERLDRLPNAQRASHANRTRYRKYHRLQSAHSIAYSIKNKEHAAKRVKKRDSQALLREVADLRLERQRLIDEAFDPPETLLGPSETSRRPPPRFTPSPPGSNPPPSPPRAESPGSPVPPPPGLIARIKERCLAMLRGVTNFAQESIMGVFASLRDYLREVLLPMDFFRNILQHLAFIIPSMACFIDILINTIIAYITYCANWPKAAKSVIAYYVVTSIMASTLKLGTLSIVEIVGSFINHEIPEEFAQVIQVQRDLDQEFRPPTPPPAYQPPTPPQARSPPPEYVEDEAVRQAAGDDTQHPIFLVSSILTAFVASKCQYNDVSLKTMSEAANAMFSLFRGATTIEKTVSTIISKLPEAVGRVSKVVLQNSNVEEEVLLTMVDFEKFVFATPRQKVFNSGNMKIFCDFYERLHAYSNSTKVLKKLKPHNIRALASVIKEYKNTYQGMRIRQGLRGVRACPYSLWIWGPPGNGKTRLLNRLIAEMQDFFPEFRDEYGNFERQNLVYARSRDSFWSGYTGQPIVTLDDIGCEREDPNVVQFLDIVKGEPWMPEMPSLEDETVGIKGTYFTSALVLTTSNTYMPTTNQLVEPGAFARRRNLVVRVECDPAVKVASKVDSTLLHQNYYNPQDPEYIRRELPHLTFIIQTSSPTNGAPLDVLRMGFRDFVATLRSDFQSHLSDQEKLSDEVAYFHDEAVAQAMIIKSDDDLIEQLNRSPNRKYPTLTFSRTPKPVRIRAERELQVRDTCPDFYTPPPRDFRRSPTRTYAGVTAEEALRERDALQAKVTTYINERENSRQGLQERETDLDSVSSNASEEVSINNSSSSEMSLAERMVAQNEVGQLEEPSMVSPLMAIYTRVYNTLHRTLLGVAGEGESPLRRFVTKVLPAALGTMAALSLALVPISLLVNGVLKMMNIDILKIIKRPFQKDHPKDSDSEDEDEPPPKNRRRFRNRPDRRAFQTQDFQSWDEEGRWKAARSSKVVRNKVHKFKLSRASARRQGGTPEELQPVFTRACAFFTSPFVHGSVFRPVGRFIMLPFHFLLDKQDQLLADGTQFTIELPNHHHPIVESFDSSKLTLFDVNGTLNDFCYYECSSNMPSGRDYRKLFQTQEDLSTRTHRSAYLYGYNARANSFYEISLSSATRKDKPLPYAEKFANEKVVLAQTYEYPHITKEGDCGMILVDPKSDKPFIGMHVCASRATGKGRSTVLTSDIFAELDRSPIVQAEPEIHCDTSRLPNFLPYKGVFTLIGRVPPSLQPRLAEKSSIVKSRAYEKFPFITPSLQAPAALSKKDPRVTGQFSPLYLGSEKYAFPGGPYNPAELDFAVEGVKQLVNSFPVFCPTTVHSEKIGINGIPGVAFFNALEFSTSPGYPYVIFRKGQKGKGYLFSSSDKNDRTITDPFLRSRLDRRLELAKQGKAIENSIWIDCLKDEKRPLHKVVAGKTRVFTIPPVDYVILSRQYLLSFCAHLMSHRIAAESCVGINPESEEWNILAEHLESNGGLMFDGDFSMWDGKMSAQVMRAAFDIIEDWYRNNDPNYTAEDALVRDVICDETIHTIQLSKDCLYSSHGGMPSGAAITSIVNSIGNMLYMRMAYFTNAPPHLRTHRAFQEYIRLAIYGDDNVLSVASPAQKFFNPESVRLYFKGKGITYTPAIKTATTNNFRPLKETQFLKRAFCINQTGQYYPCMSQADLAPILNWIRTPVDGDWDRALCDNFLSYSYFLFFHGRDTYTSQREQLQKFLSSLNIDYTLPTYTHLKSHYSGYGVLMEAPRLGRLHDLGSPQATIRPLGQVESSWQIAHAVATFYKEYHEGLKCVDLFSFRGKLSSQLGRPVTGYDNDSNIVPMEHLKLQHRDLYTELPDLTGCFVCCNPPFHHQADYTSLARCLKQVVLTSAAGAVLLPASTHPNTAKLYATVISTAKLSSVASYVLKIPKCQSHHTKDFGLLNVKLILYSNDFAVRQAQSVAQELELAQTVPPAGASSGPGISYVHSDAPAFLAHGTSINTPTYPLGEKPWSYTKYFARQQNINTYTWSTTQTAGTNIVALSAPKDFLVMPQTINAMNGYTYYRGTQQVLVTLNSTSFHMGMLIAGFVPLVSKNYLLNDISSSLTRLSQLDVIYISANASTPVEIEIPFVSPFSYLKNSLVSNNNIEGNVGTFFLTVMYPLKASDNTSTSVNITIANKWTHVELHIPRVIATPTLLLEENEDDSATRQCSRPYAMPSTFHDFQSKPKRVLLFEDHAFKSTSTHHAEHDLESTYGPPPYLPCLRRQNAYHNSASPASGHEPRDYAVRQGNTLNKTSMNTINMENVAHSSLPFNTTGDEYDMKSSATVTPTVDVPVNVATGGATAQGSAGNTGTKRPPSAIEQAFDGLGGLIHTAGNVGSQLSQHEAQVNQSPPSGAPASSEKTTTPTTEFHQAALDAAKKYPGTASGQNIHQYRNRRDRRMDKPAYTINPLPNVRRSFSSFCHVSNIDTLDRLSIDPSAIQPSAMSHFSTKLDHMNYAYLQKKPTYFATIEWTTSQTKGTSLYHGFIAPNWITINSTPATYRGVNNVIHPGPMDFLAQLHCYWCGSIKIHVKIVCTAFHRGRIIISANYGNFSATPPSEQDALKQFATVFDLKVDFREFTVILPFYANEPFLYTPSAHRTRLDDTGFITSVLGTFSINVLNELTVGNGVPNSVGILLFVSGGDDMQWSQIDTPDLAVVHPYVNPSLSSDTAVRQAGKPMPQSTVHADEHAFILGHGAVYHPRSDHVFGEVYTSLRDLAKRYYSRDLTGSDTTYATWSGDIEDNYSQRKASLTVDTPPFMQYLFFPFLTRRGSTRIKAYLKDHVLFVACGPPIAASKLKYRPNDTALSYAYSFTANTERTPVVEAEFPFFNPNNFVLNRNHFESTHYGAIVETSGYWSAGMFDKPSSNPPTALLSFWAAGDDVRFSHFCGIPPFVASGRYLPTTISDRFSERYHDVPSQSDTEDEFHFSPLEPLSPPPKTKTQSRRSHSRKT